MTARKNKAVAKVAANIVSIDSGNAVIGFVGNRLMERAGQGVIGDAYTLAGRDDSIAESDLTVFWAGCTESRHYAPLIAEIVGDVSSRESNLATYRLASIWRVAAESNAAMPESFLATPDDVNAAHAKARAFVGELHKAGEYDGSPMQSTQILFVALEHLARLVPSARAGQPDGLLAAMSESGFMAGVLAKRRELMLAKGLTAFDTVEAEIAGVAKRKAAIAKFKADKAAAAAQSAAKAAAMTQSRVKETESPSDTFFMAVADLAKAALRAGVSVAACHVAAGSAIDAALSELAEARRNEKTVANGRKGA